MKNSHTKLFLFYDIFILFYDIFKLSFFKNYV